MLFRIIGTILLWAFGFVANWFEATRTGDMGSFVMFLILFGVCLIAYYLEWKWKDHPERQVTAPRESDGSS
jgi:hypothetical protein